MSEKKEYTTDDVIAEANKWIIDVLSGNIHEWSDITDQTVALTGYAEAMRTLKEMGGEI